ncbi:MAG: hypothetical protein JWL85_700 [Candidatus Saccharibacteria bacterium]|nr:hypothetical protein [Candidatus Saccharibacteria bacterium]
MHKVSRRELARNVARQLVDGADQKKIMQEVAAYLIEHKMVNQSGMLLADLSIELQSLTGHTTAEVRTAFGLSDANRKHVEGYVREITGAKTVELNAVEDKSLKGGIIVKTPQYEYDASVKRKLNQLARGEA